MYKMALIILFFINSISWVSAYDYDTRIEDVDIVMSGADTLDFPLLDDNTSLPLKYLLSNNSLFKISWDNFVWYDQKWSLGIIIWDKKYLNTYTHSDSSEKIIYFPTNQIRGLLVTSDADLIRFEFCPYSDEFWEGNCSKSQRYSIKKLDEPYNDEYVKYQYYLNDSKIVEAKKLVENNYRPIIAIIDNGVDIQHPDLQWKNWINENEIEWNGIDDDDNGYIDDYYGWNFADDNNDMLPKWSHGTSVALIIWANTNNNIWIAGVINDAIILPIITCSEDSCSIPDVEKSIIYAVDNGANIINISLWWEWYWYNNTLSEAIAYATGKDVVVVIATWNWDMSLEKKWIDTTFTKISPVCNETEKNTIIWVSALSIFSDRTKKGLKTSWTNYGACTDIFAYGESIVITTMTWEYIVGEWTSFSAPIIAWIIWLWYSEFWDIDTDLVYKVLQESQSTWYGIDAKKYIENLGKAVRILEREKTDEIKMQNESELEIKPEIIEGTAHSNNYVKKYRISIYSKIEKLEIAMIVRLKNTIQSQIEKTNNVDYIQKLKAIEILLNESLLLR